MSPKLKKSTRLFGETRPIPADGNHKPNKTKLERPLEEGVIYLFCQSCGTTTEITKVGLREITNRFNLDKPDPEKHFLLAQGCPICQTNFQSVTTNAK